MRQIEPHGGKLVNLLINESEKEKWCNKAKGLKKIKLTDWEISDLEMLTIGAFSPLEGFMLEEDYKTVVDTKRLANGLPWTIPITLSVTKEEAEGFKAGDCLGLADDKGEILAVLHLQEKYLRDKEKEALEVYGTKDEQHPGVAKLYSMGDVILGGKIDALRLPHHEDFINYRLTPAETRKAFASKGWRRIVGFQTRNPVHRAHEYIQKCALETIDGLLLHPLVGETKGDDIPANIRMKCYEVLIQGYYPKDRVLLSVMPAAMRYAGPREAILHAIVRKNYGCTHFIVGRDHAGVGGFYDKYAAHRIFDRFPDLG
ncbi:MAG: sulfate adenylyltransferase, partial [Candidatus Omnitrophica bacterium]|nr:sulfate adenylyltransferase [Candidatus Omnitrophota bacterium]